MSAKRRESTRVEDPTHRALRLCLRKRLMRDDLAYNAPLFINEIEWLSKRLTAAILRNFKVRERS